MTSWRTPDGRNRAAVCPECGASAEIAYQPFCSKRCADLDLHRWLSEGYGIPSAEEDGEADPSYL